MSLHDLYQETILDHYQSPSNKGELTDPDIKVEEYNPVCGDQIEIYVKIEGNGIKAIKFSGQGCAISQASASMMMEGIEGKSLKEAQEFVEDFRMMMRGDKPFEDEDLGDLESLKGVIKFPIRVKCATLAWSALEKGIKEYKKG